MFSTHMIMFGINYINASESHTDILQLHVI